ncbi:hypothetical protein AB6D11_05975 [Vibrio splendidus]
MPQTSSMKRKLLTLILPTTFIIFASMHVSDNTEWVNSIIKYRVYTIEDAYSKPQHLSASLKQASLRYNTIIVPVSPSNITSSLERLNWSIINLDGAQVKTEIINLLKKQAFYDTHIRFNDTRYTDISYCFAISNKERHHIDNVHWLYSQCRSDSSTFSPSPEIINEITNYKRRFGSKDDVDLMYKNTLGKWHQALLLDASALNLSKKLQGEEKYNDLRKSLIELRLNGISDGGVDYEFNTTEYLDWINKNKASNEDAYTLSNHSSPVIIA